jgi:hypothetical protein
MEAVTLGVQEQGVIVQSKHWLLNEQVSLKATRNHTNVRDVLLTWESRNTAATLALKVKR